MESIALPKFERVYKKFTNKLRQKIRKEIKLILDNPETGELKKGDLTGISVYKFREKRQLYFLVYQVDYKDDRLYLYAIGTHEGFYKKLTTGSIK